MTKPEQAYSAGKAFGNFQLQLSDLDGSLLIDTIPNFHNGKFRFWQFEQSIKNNTAGRVDEMTDVISKLMARSAEMTQLQEWLDNGALPLRITHNDTKINNVLFGKITEFAQDRGMIALELLSNSPGMEILFDEECNNFIGQILFHMVHF